MKAERVQYGWLDGGVMAVAVFVAAFAWNSDTSLTARIVTALVAIVVAGALAGVVQARRERRSGPEGGA